MGLIGYFGRRERVVKRNIVPEEPQPDDSAAVQQHNYESPRLTVLGTVEQLTMGDVPTSTDGLSPGSLL